jgi:CheY-like chemotaxis protein
MSVIMAPKPSLRILIVDDEPSVCMSLQMLFGLSGHSTEIAASGKEALALFHPDKFDLVLTDWFMPEMTGGQLAEIIRQRAPSIPIVLMSACPPQTTPEAVDWVLLKPFSIESLQNALDQATKRP